MAASWPVAAPFSARFEFLAALQLLAEGLDAERKTNTHAHALAAAWTAMKEADDFLPRRSGLEANTDLPRILESHNTVVLKNHAEGLTPLAALKCYFTFAQQQFTAAVGHEVAGSMALHGLGKLHAATTANKTIHVSAAEPKAMVYYRSRAAGVFRQLPGGQRSGRPPRAQRKLRRRPGRAGI